VGKVRVREAIRRIDLSDDRRWDAMNNLYVAAKEISDFMASRKWKFCIIGGLAVIRWGEQRQTRDVDLSLLAGFGEEERYANELLGAFPSRVSNALEFALRNRVILLKASNGAPMDVSISGLPFEKRVIRRATPFEYAPGYALSTCSAEDLIVLKAFADRPRDWLDIEMIKVRQKNKIDWAQVLREFAPLASLKEAPEIVEKVRRIART